MKSLTQHIAEKFLISDEYSHKFEILKEGDIIGVVSFIVHDETNNNDMSFDIMKLTRVREQKSDKPQFTKMKLWGDSLIPICGYMGFPAYDLPDLEVFWYINKYSNHTNIDIIFSKPYLETFADYIEKVKYVRFDERKHRIPVDVLFENMFKYQQKEAKEHFPEILNLEFYLGTSEQDLDDIIKYANTYK